MAGETQEARLVLPREQLAREVRLQVDIRQVMGKKAIQIEGTARTKVWRGQCVQPHVSAP